MKKHKNLDPMMVPPKATVQLIDAFTDTFKAVPKEEVAEEIFTVRKLREYFQAWPIPKMPDPLPPYLCELEKRGYAMQTGYDGQPALFCIRWKVNDEVCVAEEMEDDARQVRTGMASIKSLIADRLENRTYFEEEEEEEEEE